MYLKPAEHLAPKLVAGPSGRRRGEPSVQSERRRRRSLRLGGALLLMMVLGAILLGPFSDVTMLGFGGFILWSVLQMS